MGSKYTDCSRKWKYIKHALKDMTKKSKLTLIELIFVTDLVKGNNSKDKCIEKLS